MKALWLALLAAVLSCAPEKPPAFAKARARAERDYAHGRYAQAARSWQEAADAADRPRDREEATYRVATSRERAGDAEGAKAAYQRLLRTFPNGTRAARAAYELATLELEGKRPERALELYVSVMHQYPNSGVSSRALDRCLQSILKDASVAEKLLFLDRLGDVDSTELREKVGFRRAKLLYEAERLEDAKREFVRVADEYPYPQGAYWDDALWYAADAEKRLGHPAEALSLLNRMLGERESAHFQGSYQRPRYAQAQFRIAEIYRDDLKQPERAMRAFRRVFTDHPTSLLRDDALWQEARIAQREGMPSRACNAIDELITNLPESRFVNCARKLCPSAETTRTGRCRRYIERELEDANAREHDADAVDEPQSSK